MDDSEIIDPEAIERLREWGGEKLLGQMIRLFLDNSPARMEQIRSGLETDDLSEGEQGAHSLKSSAANVGAVRVRTLAADLERYGAESDPERFRELVPALEDAWGQACSALESIYQGIDP